MSASVSGAPARSMRLAATLLATGGIWLLVRLGDVLAPAASAADAHGWMEHSDPALLVAAVLRLVGLAAGVYLGGLLALATLADLIRWRPLERMSLRLTPAVLRRWVVGSLTAGLAGGVIATPMPVGARPVQPTAAATSENPPNSGDRVETTAVMVKLDDDDGGEAAVGGAAVGGAAVGDPDDDTDAYRDSNPDADDDAWVVMPGESFWSIAEEVLAGSGASVRELTAFWARLIDANRDRLADPQNPDLLFPGQELIVPEP